MNHNKLMLLYNEGIQKKLKPTSEFKVDFTKVTLVRLLRSLKWILE